MLEAVSDIDDTLLENILKEKRLAKKKLRLR